MLPATSDSDIETIYLDSDDDNGEADDTSFCGTPAATTEAEEEDFDDDVIAYNYSNQIHCPEKKGEKIVFSHLFIGFLGLIFFLSSDAVVDATPTRLSERIQTQNKTSFESVVTKPPAIQPQLMR